MSQYIFPIVRARRGIIRADVTINLHNRIHRRLAPWDMDRLGDRSDIPTRREPRLPTFAASVGRRSIQITAGQETISVSVGPCKI